MTALVTGITGGLGRALRWLLTEAGSRVVGIATRRPADVEASDFIEADIASLDWDEVLAGVDVAFHLAAFVHRVARDDADRQRAFAVNATATQHLARACRRRGTLLVFASSVMAGTVSVAGQPASAYALSKLEAEKAIEAEGTAGLRYAIVRFPLLYGPFGRGNMERLMRAIYRRRYWPIATKATKSCLYFDDAAAALFHAAASERVWSRTLIAAPAPAPTLSAIHREAYSAFARATPWPPIPGQAAQLGASALDSLAPLVGRHARLRSMIETLTSSTAFDGSEFAAATGFVPRVSLRDGLRRTAVWIAESEARDGR